MSRARQRLTGATLAPGTKATLHELQNRRPHVQQRAVPEEILEHEPEQPVTLDRSMFLASLRSAPRGSSPRSGGCTHEHLKIVLHDTDTNEWLMSVCNTLAQGKIPANIKSALMGARLTALSKPLGGVRGIATGSTIRRLVARTLAKQFMDEFEAECAPFQCALSTRAGTDCVGQMLRAATDADPRVTILTVDGIGAHDHVLRSAMLGRLVPMPGARSLLPLVRTSYAQPSSYQWFDDQGCAHVVTQAEGGEQGDPLMPLLLSIGIQGALEEVATSLLPGEQLCAFLDDVYLLCDPSRVRFLYDLLASALVRVAGIQLHQEKTRAWNRAGVIPDNIAELEPQVWQLEGIMVLGTPNGTELYAHRRWKKVWPRRGSCGKQSRQSQICSALGSFCSKARTLGRTTPCVPCLQVFLLHIATHTTRASGTLPKSCWMEFPQRVRQTASSCRHFRCGWAVLDCGHQ